MGLRRQNIPEIEKKMLATNIYRIVERACSALWETAITDRHPDKGIRPTGRVVAGARTAFEQLYLLRSNWGSENVAPRQSGV